MGRPASAALFGVRLELRLESRKLGKRRVGVGLLLALTTRGVIAVVLGLNAVFCRMQALDAWALRTVPLAFQTMLPSAPLAAIVSLAPTAMLCGRFFDHRARFDGCRAVLPRRGVLRH